MSASFLNYFPAGKLQGTLLEKGTHWRSLPTSSFQTEKACSLHTEEPSTGPTLGNIHAYFHLTQQQTIYETILRTQYRHKSIVQHTGDELKLGFNLQFGDEQPAMSNICDKPNAFLTVPHILKTSPVHPVRWNGILGWTKTCDYEFSVSPRVSRGDRWHYHKRKIKPKGGWAGQRGGWGQIQVMLHP